MMGLHDGGRQVCAEMYACDKVRRCYLPAIITILAPREVIIVNDGRSSGNRSGRRSRDDSHLGGGVHNGRSDSRLGRACASRDGCSRRSLSFTKSRDELARCDTDDLADIKVVASR